MSRWWRAYDEAVDDPKLQRLSDRLFKAWFNLMCLASKGEGILPAIGDVAFKLHVSEHKAAKIITALAAAGLFDRREDGKFEPHNWRGRQFKSDVADATNAERQKRYRDRHAVTAKTVTVTPPRDREQNTDSETDQKEGTRAPRALAPGWPADYREQFWNEFPNKVGKADAFRKLDRLARSDKVAFPTLMLALGRYANKTDDRSFCNPATWLNGERWSDEPAAAPARQFGSPAPRPGSKEDNRERTHHALRKLSDYVDAHADEPGGSGGAREAHAGLLPFAKPA